MSTISASTTTTTAYKVTADTTGTLILQTGSGPTTAVTIDGSQNVGVGVTPSAWYTGSSWKVIELPSAALRGGSQGAALYANAYVNSGLSNIYKNTGFYSLAYQQQADTGSHAWFNAPSGTAGNAITFTQAMTLDASGNFNLGTTSLGGVGVSMSGSQYPGVIYQNNNAAGSGFGFTTFQRSSVTVGSISQNGTTGVLYNLTSDYRLKNDQQPLTGAKEFVMALQPKKWQWWDGSGEGVGFIAHEFMEVAKYSGHGEKDAVDEEGNPVYQSIQPSSSEVMANLVSLIQEQQALITQLQADVAALKG
jgi:hypothetical protein